MTITTMAFRAPKHRGLILALVVLSFLTLLFMLCGVQSGLGKAEEELAKCQQKHDSVSAQFTVLYEHKARLEKSLQAEIDRKKAVDEELKTLQLALSKDAVTQKEKVSKLLRQYEELKEQQKDEFSKLRATYESLRSEKEKLDGEVEDLNLQNQKLKVSSQKLEEEVGKLQQMRSLDLHEVAKLRKQLKVCDVAVIPGPPDSKTTPGDGSNRVAGTNVDDGKVDKPEAATHGNTTTAKDQAADQEAQDAMGVLPAPQQPAKGPSSTNKPPAKAPEETEPQPSADDLNVQPAPDQDDQNPSFLGHRFGDNVDQNQQPIFRRNQLPHVPEGQEDRDYPDHPPGALKDDDGDADEGEDAVDRKDKKMGL